MVELSRVQPLSVFDLQTFPFFGVVPAILNESGEELDGPCEGYLVSISDHDNNDQSDICNSTTCLWLLLLSVRLSVRPSGVQTAVAGCDEDGVREPSAFRDDLLQEVSGILRDRRR